MRKFKTDNGIKYGQESSEIIIYGNESNLNDLKCFSNEIKSISRSKKVKYLIGEELKIDIKFQKNNGLLKKNSYS